MKTLIKNAEIVTMTGEKYKNGCILFDEKIQYVGEDKASVSYTHLTLPTKA